MLHNAGRSQRARWEHTDIQVDLDLFNLNVFSIVHLSRCIMPHFLERNSGTFALMSSTAGKAGVPFSGSYTGSKHALHVGLFSDPIWSSLLVLALLFVARNEYFPFLENVKTNVQCKHKVRLLFATKIRLKLAGQLLIGWHLCIVYSRATLNH